jgi:hypothetical membrane protein
MSRQQIVEDGSRLAAAGARMRAATRSGGTEEVGLGAARGLERRPIAVVLALAGILGPILFTAVFVIQELFRRDEYSPMAETVSALEAGPGGWVQQVNFVGFGLLTIAFAVGLHRGMRPTRAGVVGPAILVWTGVGLVLAAVFALREDAAGATYDPTGLHDVNGAVFFLSIGVGLVVTSRRMAADPRWRSLATYALATGIALLVMFVAFGVLVGPDDAPLHPWAGLAQRVVLAVWFSCTIGLALRLLRVIRAADPQR